MCTTNAYLLPFSTSTPCPHTHTHTNTCQHATPIRIRIRIRIRIPVHCKKKNSFKSCHLLLILFFLFFATVRSRVRTRVPNNYFVSVVLMILVFQLYFCSASYSTPPPLLDGLSEYVIFCPAVKKNFLFLLTVCFVKYHASIHLGMIDTVLYSKYSCHFFFYYIFVQKT